MEAADGQKSDDLAGAPPQDLSLELVSEGDSVGLVPELSCRSLCFAVPRRFGTRFSSSGCSDFGFDVDLVYARAVYS